ncbi:Rne/Rng family ribonuclease [Dinoroseobacter sp. S76]|uniref:Rne/Rng family ribonuclease n=1 Tax=Dinoroseobacter sp. S76 TaxID=3415124 RepID=UPI003C7DD344
MAKKMLIDATHAEETRVVVVDGTKVEEFDFESVNKRQLAGNIYLAKVTRVEPSLQAAFVDYGGNRHGFLAFSEIHPDYYQIPVADREALLAEEMAFAEADAEEEEKPKKRRSRRRKKSDTAAETATEEAKADAAPVEEGADAEAPAEAVETDAAEAEDAPATEASADDAPAEDAAPVEEAAAEEPAAEDSAEPAAEEPAVDEPEPAEAAPAEEAAAEDAPADEAAAEEASAEDAPAEDAEGSAEDGDDTPRAPMAHAIEGEDPVVTSDAEVKDPEEDAEEASADAEGEAAAEEAPAEEASAEETPVEEPTPEEAPAAEEAAPAEEASAEDAPAVEADADADAGAAAQAEAEAPAADDASEPRSIPGMDLVDSTEADGPLPVLGSGSDEDDAVETAETPTTEEKPKRRRSRRRSRSKSAEAESETETDTTTETASDSDGDDGIEDVADEDVAEEIRRPRQRRERRYKIQEVIKVRQVLLVQVVKEERGNKGAALTTYLSLAGRYCVLMPNTARGGGISRKITNAADRKKLKEIASEIDVPRGAGLIVRTAGAKRTKTEIKRDYDYLKRLWEQIRDLTLKSIAPAPIYEEGNLVKRSIRDLYSRDIDEVLVEGEAGYRVAKDFMKMLMPSHAKNVKLYEDNLPLFARYQVENYLAGMFNPTVQLKSGGYLVIGVTEALVAIDVNSGRATKEASIEETALKTNLEAAEEVARQVRLRDLAGLIVIDFIDMEERRNNTAVEKRLKDKLKTDRARIQVGRISGFGLLEMSRQRLRPGMLEITTQPCPHCQGTGLIRSDNSLALSIIRALEEEGMRRRVREVLVKAPINVINYLFNEKREHIALIEGRYGMAVRLEASTDLSGADFTIDKFKTATRKVVEIEAPVISIDTSAADEIEEAEIVEEEVEAEAAPAPEEASEEGAPRKRRRRRRRRRGNGGEGSDAQTGSEETTPSEEAAEEAAPAEAEAPAEAAADADAEATEEAKPKRRRRRRRKSASAEAEAAAEAPAEEAEAAPETKSAEPEAPVEEVAAEEPAAEEPTEAPAEESAVLEAEPVAAPVEEPVAEPVEEPAEPVAEEEPAEEITEPEVEPEAVAEPEPAVEEPVAEPEPEPAEDKPKRRGWWSMSR